MLLAWLSAINIGFSMSMRPAFRCHAEDYALLYYEVMHYSSTGLEVGEHLKSKEEIRKEWEEFKARLERQKQVGVTRVDFQSWGLFLLDLPPISMLLPLPDLLLGFPFRRPCNVLAAYGRHSNAHACNAGRLTAHAVHL